MAALLCVVHYTDIKIKSKIIPLDHHKFKILNDNKKAWERSDTNEGCDHESQCTTLPIIFDVHKHGAHRECFKKFTAKRKSNIPVKISSVKRSHSCYNPREAKASGELKLKDITSNELKGLPPFGFDNSKKATRRVIRDTPADDMFTNESSVLVNGHHHGKNGFTEQTCDGASKQECAVVDKSFEDSLNGHMNGHKSPPPHHSEEAEGDAAHDTLTRDEDDDLDYIVLETKPVKKEFRLTSCKDYNGESRLKEITRLDDATARFRKDVGFQMMLEGSVNGESFSIEGNGVGMASSGLIRGKWECTTGKLPISWAAISATIGYSFKCFTYFPNGISHFFQECMPEGYTQEQFTTFQDGGIIRSFHEIVFQNGIIIDHVTMKADGFKSDSPLLSNGLKCFLPSTETTFPYENGVKSLAHHVYPTRSGTRNHIVATQATINRPMGGKERVVRLPTPYFSRAHVRQTQAVDDDTDHIIQEQILEGYDFALMDYE